MRFPPRFPHLTTIDSIANLLYVRESGMPVAFITVESDFSHTDRTILCDIETYGAERTSTLFVRSGEVCFVRLHLTACRIILAGPGTHWGSRPLRGWPEPHCLGSGVVSVLSGRIGSSILGCSPVSVCRNATMAFSSGSVNFSPSWLAPIIATACFRLQTWPE